MEPSDGVGDRKTDARRSVGSVQILLPLQQTGLGMNDRCVRSPIAFRTDLPEA